MNMELAGSVDYHEKQVFIGTDMTDWPSKIEQQISSEQMNGRNDLIRKWKEAIENDPQLRDIVKLHACSAKRDSVFLFPEAWYFENSSIDDISSLLSMLSSARMGIVLETGIALSKNAYYIFVCTHKGRDQRCGLRGPNIVRAIREKALEGIHVFECSHLGGHKYAGNLVVYGLRHPYETCSPTSTLSYHGDWYGLIEEADVEPLLDYVKVRKTIWKDKWRGSIGLSVERQKQIAQYWGLSCEDCSCDTSCKGHR